MELNYYRLIFNNGRDFIIESPFNNIESVFHQLQENRIKGFFSLKLKENTALFVNKDELFSIQQVTLENLGSQIKVWKMSI